MIFIQSMLVGRGKGGPGAPPYDLKRHREVRGVASRRGSHSSPDGGSQSTVISIQIALVSRGEGGPGAPPYDLKRHREKSVG